MTRQRSYEELIRPMRPGSLDWIRWGCLSLLMRTVGCLSEGIRMGYRYGFDSGEMLDYVYRDQPQGSFGIGRLLDRIYLNQVGWRGIRQRKIHLQALLRELIHQREVSGEPIHVVDVAAGPGRYLIELVQEFGSDRIRVTLRDWDETGLLEAQKLARERGLSGIRTERGDAFDPEDLKRISPRPQIVVVSGLYELFPDNSRLTRSLSGIWALLEPGGYLAYTNQPTHPQLEMIARVLPNREGKPWVMRLRSQEEMDRLVAQAGFHHRKTLIDQWGIFTVSLTQKEVGKE